MLFLFSCIVFLKCVSLHSWKTHQAFALFIASQKVNKLFQDGGPYHIETSPLDCKTSRFHGVTDRPYICKYI